MVCNEMLLRGVGEGEPLTSLEAKQRGRAARPRLWATGNPDRVSGLGSTYLDLREKMPRSADCAAPQDNSNYPGSVIAAHSPPSERLDK